jgi:hypothetical protein
MARIWIDPPSGWRYGFPKIWDSIESPSLPEWLAGQGYPEPETEWIRCWDVTDENDED